MVRSESDELIFRHAGDCGAKIFDGVKVEGIEFSESSGIQVPEDAKVADIGRPVSASWKRKDGTTGSIRFEYLVDASGRVGLVSTKYMKNRKYNQGLKNVASWGYWSGTSQYAMDTTRQNQPFFEALTGTFKLFFLKPMISRDINLFLQMPAAGHGASPCTTALCLLVLS